MFMAAFIFHQNSSVSGFWLYKSQHPLEERPQPPNALLLLFSLSVVFDSLHPRGLQHARLLCPSLSPGVCSKSHPLSWWCHPTISSSVIPFSSCHKSFPASGSFPMSRLFESDGQSIKASTLASVLLMNVQNSRVWFRGSTAEGGACRQRGPTR